MEEKKLTYENPYWKIRGNYKKGILDEYLYFESNQFFNWLMMFRQWFMSDHLIDLINHTNGLLFLLHFVTFMEG